LCLQWKLLLDFYHLEDIKKGQSAALQAELRLQFKQLAGGRVQGWVCDHQTPLLAWVSLLLASQKGAF
jgi:hypothetical protein